jgi:hypothetical protein
MRRKARVLATARRRVGARAGKLGCILDKGLILRVIFLIKADVAQTWNVETGAVKAAAMPASVH